MAPRNTRVNPDTPRTSPARSFAQTLDNFYAPMRDTRSEQALQRGIGQFAGIFEEKAAQVRQERDRDEYNQGVADAIRETAGQEMQGVRTGSIFRQHSRFYMAGLNEQRGKAKAIEWKNQLALDYEAWEGKNSDDPNDFKNYLNERAGVFIESLQSNPHALNAALPYINEVANNLAAQHTSYTNERLRQEQVEASHQVFGDIVAGFTGGDYDEQTAIDALAAEVDELYASGEKDAREILVDAVILEADANDSLDGLLVLAKAYDQGKIKLSKAQKLRLEQSIDSIEAEITSAQAARSRAAQAQYDASINAHVTSYTEALLANPRLDAREFYRNLGVKDEELFRKLNTIQKAVLESESNSGPTDGQIELAFQAELIQAGGDPNARAAVILKYSPHLNSADVRRELQLSNEISSGSAVHTSAHVKMLRQGYVSNVAVIESDQFNIEASGQAQTFAEALYNQQMSIELRGVDPSDYNAINEAHLKVTESVNRAVLTRFPNMVTNLSAEGDPTKKPAGEITGMSGELEKLMEEVRQQLLQNDPSVADTQGSAAEVPGNPEPEAETAPEPAPAPVAETPVDPAEMVPIAPTADEVSVQEEEMDFRSALLAKFSDGEDNRPTLETYNTVIAEDKAFAAELRTQAGRRGIDPRALFAVMDFETGGTFDPAEENMAGSGATGLIQFMPKTARALGTTTEELAKMSRTQQLRYVFKYLDQFNVDWRKADVDDVYMAVLWPAAINQPDGYVLFKSGTKAYTQNRGLDTNGDGTITKFEAASKVRKRFYG